MSDTVVYAAKYYAGCRSVAIGSFRSLLSPGKEKAYRRKNRGKMLMKELEIWYEKQPPGKGPKSEYPSL